MTLLLIVLLAVNLAALVMVSVLYRRSQRARRTRQVEAANSEYTSQYVRDLEAKQAWESLDRSILHEVNREEFERTLAKARTSSVRSLTAQERAFMDRMVEAVKRVTRTRTRKKSDGDGGARPLHA